MTRSAGALLVFLAFTAAGVSFMAPSVSFGDSGELVASSATLAIPHAPGYPLFCLLGHAVGCLVPWAGWAYRMNLLSVLCGAFALAVLWIAMRECGLGAWTAAAGTAFLGASPLWLHTCLQTEVFALHMVFGSAALWIACRYRDRLFQPRPMAALGLCLGLGGANHHTLILVVPAVLWAGWRMGRCSKREAAAGLAWMLAFGLLGLAVYLYLPIRARAFPPLDWGHPADLKSFLHVLLRRDYGSFSLTVEGAAGGRIAAIPGQTGRYLTALLRGFGPAGAGLAVLGLWAWARRLSPSRVTWQLPALWALLAGPAFLWLGNPPYDPQTSGALERFYLLSWMPLALFAAAGAELVARVPRLGRAVPALALVPILLAARTPSWAQRWDVAAFDYGKNILRSLPPGSVVFLDGGDDSFYTLAYLLFAEGLRRDIEPHDRGGLVFPNAYGPDFRRLSKTEKEARRITVETAVARSRPLLYSTLRDEILPGHDLALAGLLRRAAAKTPKGSPIPETEDGRALWEVYPVRVSRAGMSHYRYRALIPIYGVMRAAADTSRGDFGRAFARLLTALADAPDVLWVPGTVSQRAQWIGYRASSLRRWDAAERAYALAVRTRPEDAGAWLNLGVAREKRDRHRRAESAYLRGISVSPSFQGYYNLGALYWKLKRWREAETMFANAVRMDPENAKARGFAAAARRAARGRPR